MKPINTQLNFWANSLLLIGFLSLLVLSFLIYQRYNPQNLSFNLPLQAPATREISSSLEPVGITIKSLDLSLKITPAEIRDNHWESSTSGISHLKSSVIPGQKGNSILYGHNWPNILGNLKNIKVGDEVTIIYNDNTAQRFAVEYLTKVSPDDISVLAPSEDKRLTLYTCTGFLDSKRLVVVAKPLNS